jgi:ABC-2 type transport system permease protein
MYKEFIQAVRDKATFGMMIGIPIIQLLLFGFAINSNPKHLPTAIVSADNSNFTRSFLHSMSNTDYFQFIPGNQSDAAAHEMLRTNQAKFVINIPANFSRDLVRHQHPTILIEADATDPAATGYAVSAASNIINSSLTHDLIGPLALLQQSPPPYQVALHSLYNPLLITQYNIVPGLLGVVLTMTLVIITALAITREWETGTIEMLLSTPVHPLEVMLGKIIPYIIIGYIQVCVILVLGKYLFHVPMLGSIITLLIACLPFIAANLTVGLTFSTLAKNQLQAIQGAMFFFLPSLLLSGFMFPFQGMPQWAQYIGNCLPLTHFLIIVRGILLKDNSWLQIWPQIWPILLFFLIMLIVALKRYRNQLD